MPSPPIALIVAATQPSLGIGSCGVLPWRLTTDMAFFRSLTSAKHFDSASFGMPAVIMGRKTWDSIPPRFRPMKDRQNIILSRTSEQFHPGVKTYSSLSAAVSALKSQTPPPSAIFVIGGAEIYREALSTLSGPLHIFLTAVTPLHGEQSLSLDTYFPDFRSSGTWKLLPKSQLKSILRSTYNASQAAELVAEQMIIENGHEYDFTIWERS
ncbi:dihydrofolate reductase-like domain-containing protein [Lipomyces oligophaga]|uniref:dihydrofolate reductase-like domain-containing protein n=1 Tax=Lipomyces oligophaga TaxID=45792 RepID=UPI0034CD9C2D